VLNKKLTRVHLSFSHSVKERAAEEGTGVEFVVRSEMMAGSWVSVKSATPEFSGSGEIP
jgi:hypothetical protein